MARLPEADLSHILEHTYSLWDDLRGERLFITGGTGFFGRWLLESFLAANRQMRLNASAVVLTRNPGSFIARSPEIAHDPAIRLLQGDVRTFDFPDGKFSHIIHGATEASGKPSVLDPFLMFDTIVQGTRRVLEFASDAGTKNILFTSSGAVYGKQPPEIEHVPEDYQGAPDPMDVRSAYGVGKRAAEHLCSFYSAKYKFEAKIARCFTFVGPGLPLDIHFAIGNFIRDAMLGGPIKINGDGTPYRSFQYSADLAIWLWTILFKGQNCRPYNVGSMDELQISEVAALVRDTLNPDCEIEVAQEPNPSAKPSRYVPSTKRAEEELGLKNTISLKESIERTACWYRL